MMLTITAGNKLHLYVMVFHYATQQFWDIKTMIMLNRIVLYPVWLFILNALVLMLLVLTADRFILTSEFYTAALANSGLALNPDLLNIDERFKILAYTLTIVLLFLKYSLVTLLLYTGIYLNGMRVSYSSVFKIVCLSEMVFLLPAAIKVIWFLHYPPAGIREWQYFYPLSLLSLAGGRVLSAVTVYPLQLVNVFECLYVLSLVYLIRKLLKVEKDNALGIVLASYLPALLVWALLVSYYTVMINPV